MANKKTSTKDSKKKNAKKSTSTKTQVNKTTSTNKPVSEVKETPIKVEVKKETKREVKNESWIKKNYTLVCALVIALLLIVNIIIMTIGHSAKLSNGKEIIASIDGKSFTAEKLFNDLKKTNGINSLLNMVDEVIVDKQLTDEEKLKAKEDATKNVESIKSQYEDAGYNWQEVLTNYGYENEEALIKEFTLSAEKEALVTKQLKSDLTDEEIQKYYDENVFGTYTAKHILVKPATSDEMSEEEKAEAEENAKARAQEAINRLNDGEDWASLVQEYSEDTGSKDNEGLIENFTKGDVDDEFWNATTQLNDGEYTQEPVKSSYGFHVILRISHTDKESLDSMKDKLVDEIVQKKLTDDANLYNSTWAKIRKSFNFKINDSDIKKSYENILKNDAK